jgi:putative nucleotidyltransferase with HDIG domain
LDSQKKSRAALIVDPDYKFLQGLRAEEGAKIYPLITAQTGKEAQQVLANAEQPLFAVFVNQDVITPEGGPNAMSVMRFAKQHRPMMPIYLIFDGKLGLTPDELTALNVRESFAKPITYAKVLEVIKPEAVVFDPRAALAAQGAKKDEALDSELTADDSEFVAIRAADFVSGSQVLFDLYVRLGSGRYIKLLHAGDAFTPDRLKKYLEKGIENFYLRKEAQRQYLAYTNKIAGAIVKHAKMDEKIKVSQTMNAGQETMNFLRGQGVSESNLQYASGFVGNVQTLVSQLDTSKSNAFKAFVDNLAAYDHGVSTAMIAGMIAKVLKIESGPAVQIVGLAALLHDIGLYSLPPEVHGEDTSKMTADQVKIYHTHPTVGAEMLQKISGMSPSVIQAVAQHHERRNKLGFPPRSGIKMMNRVSEIVGISSDMARLIVRSKEEKEKSPAAAVLDPLQEMTGVNFAGFSSPIVEAFRIVFRL